MSYKDQFKRPYEEEFLAADWKIRFGQSGEDFDELKSNCETAHLACYGVTSSAKAITLRDGPVYLALDFDGVLHSASSGPGPDDLAAYGAGSMSADQLKAEIDDLNRTKFGYKNAAVFCLAENLSACLDATDRDVRIVISTAWRNILRPDALKTLLPEGLAKRVVGVLDRADERFSGGLRGQLMAHWIEKNDPGAQWLAIDDTFEHFAYDRARLITTGRQGICDQAISYLTDLLTPQPGASLAAVKNDEAVLEARRRIDAAHAANKTNGFTHEEDPLAYFRSLGSAFHSEKKPRLADDNYCERRSE